MTGQWMPRRDSAPGYFTAQLEFQDGTPATLIYSSSGYFMGSEFFDGTAGVGPATPGTDRRVSTRKEITSGTRDEDAAKERRAIGAGAGIGAADGQRSGFLMDLGLLVVSCERGDMRQSPAGVFVYSDEGTREEPVLEDRRNSSPELVELRDAIVDGKPVLHSGRWGLATLEVCLAIMQSAREGRDIYLERQVAVPD
jgi:phthalate 4,5-cis-dihydrodiol dehydrogenase